MHHLAIIGLLSVLTPITAFGQSAMRARASWRGAEFVLPLRILSQARGNIAWPLSWTVGHPPVAWAPGDCGVLVSVPDSVAPEAKTGERLKHSRITYFWTAPLGSIGAIRDVAEPEAQARLVGDTVFITLPPGPAVSSLMGVRPDSLRVDGEAWQSHAQPAAWLQLEYP